MLAVVSVWGERVGEGRDLLTRQSTTIAKVVHERLSLL